MLINALLLSLTFTLQMEVRFCHFLWLATHLYLLLICRVWIVFRKGSSETGWWSGDCCHSSLMQALLPGYLCVWAKERLLKITSTICVLGNSSLNWSPGRLKTQQSSFKSEVTSASVYLKQVNWGKRKRWYLELLPQWDGSKCELLGYLKSMLS